MRYLLLSLLVACIDQRGETFTVPNDPPVHQVIATGGATLYGETTNESCAHFAAISCAYSNDVHCTDVMRFACCRAGCTDNQVYAPSAAYWPTSWAKCQAEVDAGAPAQGCLDVLSGVTK